MTKTLLKIILLTLFLMTSVLSNAWAESQVVSFKDHQLITHIQQSETQDPKQNFQSEKSMGQRMVEWIRNLLEDEPSPIDDSLVRDEI